MCRLRVSGGKTPRVELDRCELRCVQNIAIGSGPPVGEARQSRGATCPFAARSWDSHMSSLLLGPAGARLRPRQRLVLEQTGHVAATEVGGRL